jgi:hypothetical protein
VLRIPVALQRWNLKPGYQPDIIPYIIRLLRETASAGKSATAGKGVADNSRMEQPPDQSPERWLRLGRLVRIPLGVTRQALLQPALSAARLSRKPFAKPIAWFLSRSLIIVIDRLKVGGFTWPLLPTNLIAPLIILNASVLQRSKAELARLLLHESAHHCGVVWPEWRNWVNTLTRLALGLLRLMLFFVRWRNPISPIFPHERIYGVGVNSADTVAFNILQDALERGWRP